MYENITSKKYFCQYCLVIVFFCALSVKEFCGCPFPLIIHTSLTSIFDCRECPLTLACKGEGHGSSPVRACPVWAVVACHQAPSADW